MKISIIIPTYKPQNYLWKCLDSIVAQTFPKQEFEVILVLNGCDEPWKTNIEKFIFTKMLGMNVNFIQTNQIGVSNARNIALDNAKGAYVTFIDDDDYVSPNYLEGLYNISSDDTIGLCYPFAFIDGKPNEQLFHYKITQQYEKIFSNDRLAYTKARKFFSGPCMKLIPMNFIQDRRYNPRFSNGEDSLFMFLISDKYQYIKLSGKDVCYYRRFRDNSAYTRKRTLSYKLRNTYATIIEYCRIYFKNPQKYNLLFFTTRIIGACRSFFY